MYALSKYKARANFKYKERNTMAFKSDIEIAQETTMLPIMEIAKTAGVDEKYIEQYGKYKAKVD